MKTSIECVGNNILVTLPEIEEKTEGGIIKDDAMIAAEQEAADEQVLEVIAVGDKVEMIKPGHKVLVKNPRMPIYTIDGKRYGGVCDYDVFAIIG